LSSMFGGSPSTAPSTAPNNPLSSMFGGTPSSEPSTAPTEKNSPTFIDKPCHPGSCLGTPGFYTVKGHHHCYEGTRDCIQTSHFKDGHYGG
jgi:hypothetical protein